MYRLEKNKLPMLLLVVLALLSGVRAGIARKRKQICVVGSGAAGLASIKQFAEADGDFDVVAFEKNSEVGGLWIYNESADLDEHNLPIHGSMYKLFRTNLPKELMAFPDYREFRGEDRSCVTHETVLSYLKNYTDHFNLRPYVKLNTLVEKITPTLAGDIWKTTKYNVQTRNLDTNETAVTSCDAVAVCNGHYFEPRIPKIPGIEGFRGKVMHSHSYRRPDEFANRTVVVLGAAACGIDISIEMSEIARTVYLSHNNKNKIEGNFPSNVVQVAGVVGANGSGLLLENGDAIAADSLFYCTGYVLRFPFLDGKSGLEIHDNYVIPLYKHLINIEYPSMALIGMPTRVIDFPLFYAQARYFASLLSGKAELPARETMLADANELPVSQEYPHSLGDAQWSYNNELADAGAFERLPRFYEKGLRIWLEHRARNIVDYKRSNMRVHDNGDVEILRPEQTQNREI